MSGKSKPQNPNLPKVPPKGPTGTGSKPNGRPIGGNTRGR